MTAGPRLVALMSGGIDSPVAAYLMAKQGAEIVLLHMDNRPFGDDRGLEKVSALAGLLRRTTGQEMPLLIADHGQNQAVFRDCCDNRYQCILCKRMMLRTAEGIAERMGCMGIVMGDSLGQVASQTLRNIRTTSEAVSMPVLRPLIGLDKLDIESIGKGIGTYEISIRPETACTAVPPHPMTQADAGRLSDMESRLDIRSMTDHSVLSAFNGT